ncbi:MAG: 50S ribosomal protein L11 methyltransferase [Candidatus Omnitrophica bacterium]|nr:50S ribosomal protein L11 methyltransferase [Candidatus Omnitrophota bacterium]
MPDHHKKRIYEIILAIPRNQTASKEILRQVLLNTGFSAYDIIETTFEGRDQLSVYHPDKQLAQNLRRQFKKLTLRHIDVIIQSIFEQDWQTRWKKSFTTFSLTPNLDVVPRWEVKKYTPQKNKDFITIDTSIAFGTGLHATTRFMALFIERCRGKFRSFLDIGTGTGILLMIALKNGANQALVSGVDISKDAIKIAKENLEANSFKSGCLKVKDIHKDNSPKTFDFVAANLITQDLIDSGKKIVGYVKPDGYLAVSGISINSYPRFREAFKKYPLQCLKIHKGEGWTGILFKKRG